jgi:hypothetical protein
MNVHTHPRRRGIAAWPPAVVIRLELESPPQVLLDCLNESEEVRVVDWLGTHPALVELVDLAFQLREAAV